MPIKYVELLSIDARRFSRKGERIRSVRIDNNSTVTLVSEISEHEANVEFRFTANYVGLGVITIEGYLVYEGDAQELARLWRKGNNMPDEVASEIHTAVMHACLPEALMISRDLKLPPPFPLPQINIKPSRRRGGAAVGMEVA
jgi:hypothetical protein